MKRTASTRRHFLEALAIGATLPLLQRTPAGEARRPRVAVIYTVLRFRSHAFNFLENCLRPLLFNGKLVQPPIEVASLYAAQRADEGDMTDDTVRRFKQRLSPNIADALTLGTGNLAVDGVLLIGEHGEYPYNELGQHLYPRKEFFDQIVAVMRRSNRFVPIFNDKHLSYRWDWAREMYDTARKLGIPLMAGSSVPLAQRRPELEPPAGAVYEEAVSIHAGGFESYDFHGLEVLQSMIESRKGGETGIASVQFLEGEALFKAARQGHWSPSLAEAALRLEFGDNVPDLRTKINGQPTHGLLIRYRDGLKAAVLRVGRRSDRWLFAGKLAGEARPRATSFYVGPWGNRNLFMALTNAVQQFIVRRQEPYPIERTLLTTGALEAAVRSRSLNGQPLTTPHLNIAYRPVDFRAYREMGASWRRIASPQTMEIRELPLMRP